MDGEGVKTAHRLFLEKIDGKGKMWSTVVMRRLCKVEKESRMYTNYFAVRKGLDNYFTILDCMTLAKHLSSLPSKVDISLGRATYICKLRQLLFYITYKRLKIIKCCKILGVKWRKMVSIWKKGRTDTRRRLKNE